jgi:hypothetical protein
LIIAHDIESARCTAKSLREAPFLFPEVAINLSTCPDAGTSLWLTAEDRFRTAETMLWLFNEEAGNWRICRI